MLRGRLLLRSYAELPPAFALDGISCVSQTIGFASAGIRVNLVDLSIVTEDLTNAYAQVLALSEDLADRINFVSYAPTACDVLSVTVPEVRIGETFQMAVPYNGDCRTSVKIAACDIEQLDRRTNETASIGLRMLRLGMSESLPFRKMSDLWSGLEAVANHAARVNGEFVEEECSSCGTVRSTGRPASHRRIRSYLLDSKSPEQTDTEAARFADEIRRLRGKLLHGGALYDAEFRRQVDEQISKLQTAATIAVARELGMKAKSNECFHVGPCCLTIDVVATGSNFEDFRLTPRRFEVKGSLSRLPEEVAESSPNPRPEGDCQAF